MAALAVVPATVVANLCLSMGNSNRTLTPWKNRYVCMEPVFLVFGLRCIYQKTVKKTIWVTKRRPSPVLSAVVPLLFALAHVAK